MGHEMGTPWAATDYAVGSYLDGSTIFASHLGKLGGGLVGKGNVAHRGGETLGKKGAQKGQHPPPHIVTGGKGPRQQHLDWSAAHHGGGGEMHRFSPDCGGLLSQQCGSKAAPERTVGKGHGAPVYGRGSIGGGEIERQKRIRSCGTLG